MQWGNYAGRPLSRAFPGAAGLSGLACGATIACVLTKSGAVVLCASANEYSNYELYYAPPPSPGDPYVSLVVLYSLVCGVRASGTVVCGALHYGISNRTAPGVQFAQLSSVSSGVCGASAAGAAYCWGDSIDGRLASVPGGLVVAAQCAPGSVRGSSPGSCTQCPAGSFAPGGGTACVPCAPHTVSVAEGAAFCAACEAGYYSAGGVHACAKCPPGMAGAGAPGAGCMICPSGSAPRARGGCAICPTGSTATSGASACTPCAVPGACARGMFRRVVAVGSSHTCVLGAGGAAVCFGVNSNKQAAPPAGEFISLAAGEAASCGISTSGVLSCWGSTEQPSSGSGPFAAVCLGLSFGCYITIDGRVGCFGDNTYGRASPNAERGAIDVACGRYHACALAYTGTVVCWGMLPFNSKDSGESFSAVACGRETTCGIRRAGGSVLCWCARHGRACVRVCVCV